MDSRTKWSYCIGATGRDAAYALVSMFVMLYIQYTMKLSTAQYAVISVGMIICMVWDAINDILMGILIENTHFKLGKFKPWILSGSIINAIIIVAMFTIRPSGWGFVVFFLISYLLWGMTFTMNDIAYWGLLPSLSSDPKVRNSLVTIMSIFVCIGQFSVAGIVPTVVAGNAVNAYRSAALIVALAFVGFQLLTVLGVRERGRVEGDKKLSLSDILKVFSRNDQLITIGIASLLFNIGCNILIVFGVNFFYVEFGYSDSGYLVFMFTVMYGLGTLISQIIYSVIANKFTRDQVLKVTVLVILIGYVLFIGFGYIIPKNALLLDILAFIVFFFQGLYNLILIVMLNNTIEYDEYRFNERHDSVISAVRSFSVKLAGGINQGILTLTLILTGIYEVSQQISHLENQVAENVISSEDALLSANTLLEGVTRAQAMGLRIGMFGIPLAVLVVAYIIIKKKYIIDENEYTRLVTEIEARKQA